MASRPPPSTTQSVPAATKPLSDGGEATVQTAVSGSGNWRRWWPVVVSLGLYLVLTILLFGTSITSTVTAGPHSQDTADQIWFLAWAHYALVHGLNPFYSTWQNYPHGINLLGDTSMSALGILLSPITALFGPVVSWDVLVRLAVVVSAMSMCLCLRRWTAWWPAAFVGGLLYGFSPYITYDISHVFIVFVPLPPLMFLLLYEILVRQVWRPGRTGALLGALCAIQYLISSEILVSTIVIGAIATVIYLAASRKDLAAKWPYMKVGLIFTLLVGGLLLSYPVLFTLFGPEHLDGAPQRPATLALLHGDLISVLKPGSMQWIAPQRTNEASYLFLGVPLVLAVIVIVVWLRKRGIVVLAAAMAVIAFILSLGSTLYIGSYNTHIPLPFEVLASFPYLDGLIAERLSLYTSFFCAGIIAVGLEELHRRLLRPNQPGSMSHLGRHAWASGLPLLLAVLIALPLVPGQTEQSSPSRVSHFFTSAMVHVIPEGSVVLAYPYPRASTNAFATTDLVDQAMLDQAAAGMRYKLVGGYGWWPHTPWASATAPALKPTSVESLFDVAFYGSLPDQDSLLSTNNLASDIRQFVRRHHIDTVIVPPIGKYPDLVIHQVTAAIGLPRRLGGVDVWSNVQQRLETVTPRPGPPLVAVPPTTGILRPAAGATLSGVQVLDAGASAPLGVTKVIFSISGQGKTISQSATTTAYGWLSRWNTTSVPNGTYKVRSVAYGITGLAGTSTGIAVSVKN